MGMTRTKPTRIRKQLALTVADLPASANDQVTIEITGLPVRGLVRRVTTVFESGTAWGGTADAGGMYLHTSGTAGTANLSSAEGITIFGNSAFNPTSAEATGADLDLVATTQFVWCQTMNFSGSTQGALVGSASDFPFYDVSGGVLGPDANDGTIYVTIIGDGNIDYASNVVNAQLIIEIEPCY